MAAEAAIHDFLRKARRAVTFLKKSNQKTFLLLGAWAFAPATRQRRA
jgi:hypothetical protein